MVRSFVSEKELARTYDPDSGWETVKQYREAKRLSEEQSDLARAEIARRVNRPPSAIRGWLVEGKTPRVVQAIQTARDRGWVDIDSESEQFRALNQLVAWVYSGGGIQADHMTPYFSVDDPLTVSTLTHLLRWLDVPYRYRNPDESDSGREIIPSDGGSLLGRVLSILGTPVGVKATQDLDLPPYLVGVAEEHRRDFARVHLLNRGNFAGGKTGTNLHVPTEDFCHDLQALFDDVADGSATISDQQFLWISAATVRDLAGSTPIRSALATQLAHGTLQPPTDRAFASTYRRTNTPSGYGYLKLYQQIRDSESAPESASQYVSRGTIRNWRQGTKPYVQTGIEAAHERKWLPAVDSSNLGLTALLAWVLASGTLRDTYYPVFRCPTDTHRARFDSIATTVGFPYDLLERGSDQNTEARPSEYGSSLGRCLYALGATRGNDDFSDVLIPPYLFHHPAHARCFAEIWWLHHRLEDDMSTISIPSRFGDLFPSVFEELLTDTLGYAVERDGRQVCIPDFDVPVDEIPDCSVDNSES